MNSTYFSNVVMGNIFATKTDVPLPTQYFIALSSTPMVKDGTGITEPSFTGTGYARVLLESLSTPTDGVVSNTADVRFPRSTTAWGKLEHYAIYDAATDGHCLMSGPLNKPRTVEDDNIIILEAGSIKLELKDSIQQSGDAT